METFAFLTAVYLCRRHMAAPAHTCRVTRVPVCGCTAPSRRRNPSEQTWRGGHCEDSNLIFCLQILFGLLQHTQGRYFFIYHYFSFFFCPCCFSAGYPLPHLISQKNCSSAGSVAKNPLLIWRLGSPPPPLSKPAHPPAGTLTDVLHCRLKNLRSRSLTALHFSVKRCLEKKII